jgi:hypothetical protein
MQQKNDQMFSEAVKAFKRYSGATDDDDEEEFY